MNVGGKPFHEVWLVDFEFGAAPGENPDVRCMVAREAQTGRVIRMWYDDLAGLQAAPFGTGRDCLMVAYYASAEIGCFLALGWPLPVNVLDLYVEFRNLTNGANTPQGAGLLGAMQYFGLDALSGIEKDSMRQLALRGGTYTEEEKRNLLEYCESDVNCLAQLLPRMDSHLRMPIALRRGRYMKAVAAMERNGVPLDAEILGQLRDSWDRIREQLISEIDADYGVFDGLTFKADRWERYVQRNKLPWPRLTSGRLALDDDTFRQMAKSHPIVAPIRELRSSLSEMRLNDLAVGHDGRNRCLLSPFASRTGRNQPSNSKFVFGPSVWLRHLIKPDPGWCLAYIDWKQQEFGIAAALSGDAAMMAAYSTGDPYLGFAKRVGAVPADATKASHGEVREQFKQCILAVQYGMGPKSLGERLGKPESYGRSLIDKHRRAFPKFWKWQAGAQAQAATIARAQKLNRIIAVSCNPVTFIRDAGILTAGGYRLKSVQLVDQFIWSAHSELVGVFSR